MSFLWADFPSGQPGLYGSDSDMMVDGTPWVAIRQAGPDCILDDPDAVNFPNGKVYAHGAGSAGPVQADRMVLPTPHQKVGLAWRFYCQNLPTIERAIITFNTALNQVNYMLTITPTGSMRILDSLEQEIADSGSTVVLAAGWNHLELVIDVVTGDYELRKNGVAIPGLTGTDGSPVGGTTDIVGFPDRLAGDGSSGRLFLSKDIVLYNGAGTQFNDFQGTVSVYDTLPESDVDLGDWTLSSGTEAFALLDEAPPDDAGYVQSGLIPTNPFSLGMTNLPVDITSVRGVMMIMRGFNSDSGDGSVQMSVSPNAGVDTDSGAEHAMTTSGTYYYDASELSPATGAAWTPTEVNNITFYFDRTV